MYLVPIFIAAVWAKRTDIYVLAVVTTAFLIARTFLSPPELANQPAGLNLALQIAVVWFAAYMLARQSKVGEELRAHEQRLARAVAQQQDPLP
jgi:hypothetical protein